MCELIIILSSYRVLLQLMNPSEQSILQKEKLPHFVVLLSCHVFKIHVCLWNTKDFHPYMAFLGFDRLILTCTKNLFWIHTKIQAIYVSKGWHWTLICKPDHDTVNCVNTLFHFWRNHLRTAHVQVNLSNYLLQKVWLQWTYVV